MLQKFSIPARWEEIHDIRHEIRKLLSSYGPSLQNSAMVVVSELMENAVKYGSSNSEAEQIGVEVEVKDKRLTIRVSNGFEHIDKLERLKDYILKLQKSDPFEMMVRRVMVLSRIRGEFGGLGIYRIAAEGGFKLELEYDKDVVTIVAQRPISEEEWVTK